MNKFSNFKILIGCATKHTYSSYCFPNIANCLCYWSVFTVLFMFDVATTICLQHWATGLHTQLVVLTLKAITCRLH